MFVKIVEVFLGRGVIR